MHLRKVMDRLMVLNPLENLAKQYHDALGEGSGIHKVCFADTLRKNRHPTPLLYLQSGL